MRKRFVAVGVATIIATPALMVHHPVSAATAHDCVGTHTWSMPGNSLGLSTGTLSETWNRTCASVDTGAGVFGLVTLGPDVFNGPSSVAWSGNCAFSLSGYVNNGIRLFIGPVTVAVGVQGTSAATSVGALGVPSVTPCTGGAITWSGVENYAVEP